MKIKHVYEFYPLYYALYGRPAHNKSYGALTACIAVEEWERNNKIKGALNVLELFAGNGEHKQHFLSQYKGNLDVDYKELDLYCDTNENVIQGNALDYDYSKHNVVLAYYYSLGTTFIQGKVDSRKMLDTFTGNLYNTLPKKSCAFFHISDNTIKDALSYIEGVHKETELHLYNKHPLLEHFGIKGTGSLYLSSFKTYDRITCCTYEHLTRLYVVGHSSGKKHFITVEQPFVQRFWSECELVDSFRIAGFNGFEFYRNELSYGEDYCKLKRTVSENEGCPTHELDNVQDFLSTDILVYK